jgi:hypothetical protein
MVSLSKKVGSLVVINFVPILSLVLYESSRDKDINWDLLNYHYYSVYSLFHNRLAFDVAPANIQGFFNPILNIPSYVLIRYYSPNIVRPAISLLNGLSFSVAFMLTLSIIGISVSNYYRYFLAISAGVVSCCGPGFLSIAGTSFVDNLCVLPVLGSLVALFSLRKGPGGTEDADVGWRAYGASAFLMGVAVGVKLTNMVFAIGYAAAVIATVRFGRHRDAERLVATNCHLRLRWRVWAIAHLWLVGLEALWTVREPTVPVLQQIFPVSIFSRNKSRRYPVFVSFFVEYFGQTISVDARGRRR